MNIVKTLLKSLIVKADIIIMLIVKFFFSKRFFKKNNNKIFFDHFNFNIKYSFLKKNVIIDLIILKLTSFCYKLIKKFSSIRIIYKIKQTSWYFFKDIYSNIYTSGFKSFFKGISYFWLSIRFWFLGLILMFTTSYFLLYIRLLQFNKIVFEYLLIIMFLYWLMSGFVFFIKKYQYSKFTSVIQRFWKRTYIIFWLIESGIFLIFFYLTLNASEESFYMYDQIKIYKTHLFSWRYFLLRLPIIIVTIFLSYLILLNLKWNLFSKISLYLLTITLSLLYLLWLEFYQFFHIINFFGNLTWTYDYDEFLWNLDLEFRRTRLVNNYISICLIAKFWHLIFIFIFWIFFLLRINEIGRVRYTLLSANMQNFIILYIMSWLYMYPWLKFVSKPKLSVGYYWFFFNFRSLGLRVFFNDLKLFYISAKPNIDWQFSGLYTGLFFYWNKTPNRFEFLQKNKPRLLDIYISKVDDILRYYLYLT